MVMASVHTSWHREVDLALVSVPSQHTLTTLFQTLFAVNARCCCQFWCNELFKVCNLNSPNGLLLAEGVDERFRACDLRWPMSFNIMF